jgi:hypothetical protein
MDNASFRFTGDEVLCASEFGLDDNEKEVAV